jgi:mannose-6-phosphate isomerase-like protein (cupin superfamily)
LAKRWGCSKQNRPGLTAGGVPRAHDSESTAAAYNQGGPDKSFEGNEEAAIKRRSVPKVLAGLAAAAAQPFPSGAQQASAASEPAGSAMQAFEIGKLFEKRGETDRPWLQFLRSPALYCGVYVLAAGSEDKQKPHSEDEVYYVESGRATIRVDGVDRAVGPGSIVYVKAHAEHRFHGIEEESRLLVFFSTAKV